MQVATCERGGRVHHAVAPADDLELAMAFQRIAELRQTVAAACDEDASLLASRYRCIEAHRDLPFVLRDGPRGRGDSS